MDEDLADRLGYRTAEKTVDGMVDRMVFLTMVVWTAVKRVDKMAIYWAVQLVDLKDSNMVGKKVEKKADRMVVYWVVQSGDSLVA